MITLAINTVVVEYDFKKEGTPTFSFENPEKYDEYLDWLIHFMEFFSSTKLHSTQKQNALKPTQKGVLLTTMSILMLQKDLLLPENGFEFVLSARFSNDCIGKLM